MLSKRAVRQHLGCQEHDPMSEGHTERLESALDGKYRIQRKLGEGGR